MKLTCKIFVCLYIPKHKVYILHFNYMTVIIMNDINVNCKETLVRKSFKTFVNSVFSKYI